MRRSATGNWLITAVDKDKSQWSYTYMRACYVHSGLHFYDNILIQKWSIDLKKINDKAGYWFWFKSMGKNPSPFKEKEGQFH